MSLPIQEQIQVEITAKELYLLGSTKAGHIEFHGQTMYPFLQDGDELVVEPVEWKEIRVGDIITYRLEDKFPTYRVAGKTRAAARLKADNWPAFQTTVGKEDVVGKVVQRKRGNSILSQDDWSWRFYSGIAVARAWSGEMRCAAGRIKRKITAGFQK